MTTDGADIPAETSGREMSSGSIFESLIADVNPFSEIRTWPPGCHGRRCIHRARWEQEIEESYQTRY